MKSLLVEKLNGLGGLSLDAIPAALDRAAVLWNDIACDTWKCSEHNPVVKFRIAHCGDSIVLHFHVSDNEIRAHEGKDNGRIWEDSCCEFFLSPECNGYYYNFECNCIGRLLLHGADISTATSARPNAPAESYAAVKRWSSLGSETFEAVRKECEWDLVEVIPVRALFDHNIESLDGLRMRANFYKCADMISEPHFLSWAPIDLPSPKFHCPEFFGELIFKA